VTTTFPRYSPPPAPQEITSSPASSPTRARFILAVTNLCRDYCGYCTFRRDPENPGRLDDSRRSAEIGHAGEKLGCTEALFSLGDKRNCSSPRCATRCAIWDINPPALSESYVRARVTRDQLAAAPPTPACSDAREWHCLRMRRGLASMGLMLESVNSALLAPARRMIMLPIRFRRSACALSKRRKAAIPFTTGY